MDAKTKRERIKQVEIVDNHVQALLEHFDTVQIFVTRDLGVVGTVHMERGMGNWFARRGQVEGWICELDEPTESEP